MNIPVLIVAYCLSIYAITFFAQYMPGPYGVNTAPDTLREAFKNAAIVAICITAVFAAIGTFILLWLVGLGAI